MGGHHSKQTVQQTADLLSSVTMSNVGSCVTAGTGENVLDVYGTGNIVDGVKQDMSLNVDGACVMKQMNDSDLQTKLAQEAAQEMSEKGVAGLSWADTGDSDQDTTLSASIKNLVDMESVQSCTSSLGGRNIVRVAGRGNIVRNVAQNMTGELVTNCMLQGAQTSKMATDMSQTANQKSTRIMENPLQPFADALTSLFKGPLMIMAAVFVILIIAGIVMQMAKSKGQPLPGGALGQSQLESLAAKALA